MDDYDTADSITLACKLAYAIGSLNADSRSLHYWSEAHEVCFHHGCECLWTGHARIVRAQLIHRSLDLGQILRTVYFGMNGTHDNRWRACRCDKGKPAKR